MRIKITIFVVFFSSTLMEVVSCPSFFAPLTIPNLSENPLAEDGNDPVGKLTHIRLKPNTLQQNTLSCGVEAQDRAWSPSFKAIQ